MSSLGDEPQAEDRDTVTVSVDCRDGSVVSAHFSCLYKQLVAKLPATPLPGEKNRTPITTNEPPPPDILQQQLQRMVADLRAWAPKLGIPETYLSEDWVRQNIFRWFMLTKQDKSHRWVCSVRCKAGWQFGFREGRLCGWVTPNAFFGPDDRPPDLNRMAGKWRLNQEQAAQLVRKTMRELGVQPESVKVTLTATGSAEA